MVFDTKSGNEYIKSIFNASGGVFSELYFKVDSGITFSSDIDKKIYLAKKIIKQFKNDYEGDMLSFVFLALLAACLDKTDFDEKISVITDFAHMAEISENIMFDITQVIKIVFGEIELWSTDRKKLNALCPPVNAHGILNVFWEPSQNPEGYKTIFSARARHDGRKEGVIFRTWTVPRCFEYLIIFIEDNAKLRINKKQEKSEFTNSDINDLLGGIPGITKAVLNSPIFKAIKDENKN